jgi:antitoxin VapB
MALHIRDPETDAVVRRLAKKKGVGITEAVREAARNELEREQQKLSLWERTADIRGCGISGQRDRTWQPR